MLMHKQLGAVGEFTNISLMPKCVDVEKLVRLGTVNSATRRAEAKVG